MDADSPRDFQKLQVAAESSWETFTEAYVAAGSPYGEPNSETVALWVVSLVEEAKLADGLWADAYMAGVLRPT